mmetsp:Transcript_78957/g.180613  ORF Transcript_78957/g.180613 Transcript_78957/m.180613 type:complete len:210 (-) Transcript_78957:499-1128(-)
MGGLPAWWAGLSAADRSCSGELAPRTLQHGQKPVVANDLSGELVCGGFPMHLVLKHRACCCATHPSSGAAQSEMQMALHRSLNCHPNRVPQLVQLGPLPSGTDHHLPSLAAVRVPNHAVVEGVRHYDAPSGVRRNPTGKLQLVPPAPLAAEPSHNLPDNPTGAVTQHSIVVAVGNNHATAPVNRHVPRRVELIQIATLASNTCDNLPIQ